MQSHIEKLKNSEISLLVTIDEQELQKYVKEALSLFRKETKANGYRQGKVPDEMLKKTVGEDNIKEEALNIAVSESMARAIRENNLEVFEYSKIEIKENTPTMFKYSVKLLLFPEVSLADYRSLHIKAKPISVEENEIDKTVEELRRMKTEYTVSTAPIKESDRVEVDFEVKDLGQIIEGGKSENHPLVIGSGKFVPGFEDQLKGMTVDQDKSFSLTMPNDYYQKDIAGKTLDFHVMVKKVESPKAIAVDDDFAKSLGRFENIDQLRTSVYQGIMQEKQEKEAERIRLAVIDEILKGTKIEVPPVLLEKQLDSMMKNFDAELHKQGMEMGLYLAHIKKTQDELRDGFKSQAEKQAKTSLVIREIGKKEAIVVTDQEIEERLTELNAAINLQESLVQNNFTPEELTSRIRQTLFDEKVFEFLLSKAVVQ